MLYLNAVISAALIANRSVDLAEQCKYHVNSQYIVNIISKYYDHVYVRASTSLSINNHIDDSFDFL